MASTQEGRRKVGSIDRFGGEDSESCQTEDGSAGLLSRLGIRISGIGSCRECVAGRFLDECPSSISRGLVFMRKVVVHFRTRVLLRRVQNGTPLRRGSSRRIVAVHTDHAEK